ncbi:hypothetical protein OAL22_01160, partial [bacterium]|nr:hypothetical protein [bacterium]
GSVIFSGQFRMIDGVPKFVPLVAYCDWQGVKRDFFLLLDADLTSVEREYRDSLSRVPLRTWELSVIKASLNAYLENLLPLSPARVMDCVRTNPSGNVDSTKDLRSGDIHDFYLIFRDMQHKAISSLETRLQGLGVNTLENLVRAKMPLTKAGQKWNFWCRLQRNAAELGSANQEIKSWENDRLVFTSGVTVTLKKEDARKFLEGKLSNLRTDYGEIDSYPSLLVCGCHRLCINHVRGLLGMPPIDKEAEENLPPCLKKLKTDFKEIERYKVEEITNLQTLYSEKLAEQDMKETVEERRELKSEIFRLQTERQQYRHKQTREIRVSLDKAYTEVKNQLREKLKKTDEYEDAVKESEEQIRIQYAKDKKESDFYTRSAECLESLRAWIDYVALDNRRNILKTN